MRKITEKIVSAFITGNPRSLGNSSTDGNTVSLFGNLIAKREGGMIHVTLAGWNTPTTRERVNGICDAAGAGLRRIDIDAAPVPRTSTAYDAEIVTKHRLELRIGEANSRNGA